MRVCSRATLAALVAMGALVAGFTAAPAWTQEADEALTVWWVIFNNPERCATSPCGVDDLFAPAVQASVLYATGALTDADGRVSFHASLYETGGRVRFVDPNTSLLGGPGLANAGKAEIHAVVRSHGPALRDVPGGVRRQLTEFMDPGCSDVGGPNECVDIQFSVHPRENWTSPVFHFDDGSEVAGASSKLIRSAGVVKLILQTRVQ